MGTSLLTKKRIAKAFKKQLIEKGFEKVSVVEVMQEAAIRRQTFYNHFLDKYELLDWIFKTELEEQITDNLNYISGWKLLDELLYYFDSNQSFYARIFSVNEQNDFRSCLSDYVRLLLEKIIDEWSVKQEVEVVGSLRLFLLAYHTKGLVGFIEAGVVDPNHQLHTSYRNLVSVLLQSLEGGRGQ
ncbi:TPA: dihydroxyacetone kinase transcriptional activator DhaS [Streptococcus suis]